MESLALNQVLSDSDLVMLAEGLIYPVLFSRNFEVSQDVRMKILERVGTKNNTLFLATLINRHLLDQSHPSYFSITTKCLFDLIHFYFGKDDFKKIALDILTETLKSEQFSALEKLSYEL